MIKKLKRFISEESRNKGDPEDKSFLIWYAKMRLRRYNQLSYTDWKDGGIDYVVEGDDKIIFLQGKFGKPNIDQIRAFAHAIEAWKDETSFNNWIKYEVKSKNSKTVFNR
ncbi:hypothetical protein FJZ53_01885, partial [Candidatus Woesearchaeota archaeon]|nr:hypothetical protein [Candidatus Woesearchaeota archaeon]